jgi:hypothetical protein
VPLAGQFKQGSKGAASRASVRSCASWQLAA